MTDLAELALREAVLKTLADAVADQLKDAKAEVQAALVASGATRVDATLPAGVKVATLSRATPKEKAEVTDPDAFLAWVRETSPGEVASRVVTEVRPAFLTALLAEMTKAGAAEVVDRETGEVREVSGVVVRPGRSSSHSVRPVDGGREAIVAAWRDGQLSHLDLPQLDVGGRESSSEAA